MSKKTNLEAVFKEIADKHEETFEINDWLDFQNNLQAEGLTSASSGNAIVNSLQQVGSFIAKNFLAMSVLVTTTVLPSMFKTSEAIPDINNENILVEENTIEIPKTEKQSSPTEINPISTTEPNLKKEEVNPQFSNYSGKKQQLQTKKGIKDTESPPNNHTEQPTEEEKLPTYPEKVATEFSSSTDDGTKIVEKTQVENVEVKENKNSAKEAKKALRKQQKEAKKKEKEQKRKESKVDNGDFQYLFKKNKK